MIAVLDTPILVMLVALVVQVVSLYVGEAIRSRLHALPQGQRESFSIVQSSALGLLALLIGFSFSMAISRYDLRKALEEAEANAIGAEYVRSDLLASDAAASMRDKLQAYLERRVSFYTASDGASLAQIARDEQKLQADLWSLVVRAAKAEPTPTAALVVAGLNDVLNAKGYTEGAWANRVPVAAWGLMMLVAMACCAALGYGQQQADVLLLLTVPITVSVSFLLVADIDSPRGGFIQVPPHILLALATSLGAPTAPQVLRWSVEMRFSWESPARNRGIRSGRGGCRLGALRNSRPREASASIDRSAERRCSWREAVVLRIWSLRLNGAALACLVQPVLVGPATASTALGVQAARRRSDMPLKHDIVLLGRASTTASATIALSTTAAT